MQKVRGFGVSRRRSRPVVRREEVSSEVVADQAGFAALLREMKLRAGLTVPEVAARMGVSPNTVHQYFYRKRGRGGTSTMKWFLRYAEACDCQVVVEWARPEGGVERSALVGGRTARVH